MTSSSRKWFDQRIQIRTHPHKQNRRGAARRKRLSEGASPSGAKKFGRDGEIVVKDFRRKGSRKARYMVDPESLDRFIEARGVAA